MFSSWTPAVLFERRTAKKRVHVLMERAQQGNSFPSSKERFVSAIPENILTPSNQLERICIYSGTSTKPWMLCSTSATLGVLVAGFGSQFLSAWFFPFFFLAGASLPLSILKARGRARALDFLSDYPTVLLATASSIKIGLTPANALERATRLLPSSAPVRREVERLIGRLRRGESRQQSLDNFARDIDLPDLELFRAAFLLVLENGGRFAPTLERLASVSKDRAVLIGSARVSTATMRMTANFLLAAAPFIVSLIAARTPDFWELFLHHPVANKIATAGVVIILTSYALLRRMSEFKP